METAKKRFLFAAFALVLSVSVLLPIVTTVTGLTQKVSAQPPPTTNSKPDGEKKRRQLSYFRYCLDEVFYKQSGTAFKVGTNTDEWPAVADLFYTRGAFESEFVVVGLELDNGGSNGLGAGVQTCRTVLRNGWNALYGQDLTEATFGPAFIRKLTGLEYTGTELSVPANHKVRDRVNEIKREVDAEIAKVGATDKSFTNVRLDKLMRACYTWTNTAPGGGTTGGSAEIVHKVGETTIYGVRKKPTRDSVRRDVGVTFDTRAYPNTGTSNTWLGDVKLGFGSSMSEDEFYHHNWYPVGMDWPAEPRLVDGEVWGNFDPGNWGDRDNTVFKVGGLINCSWIKDHPQYIFGTAPNDRDVWYMDASGTLQFRSTLDTNGDGTEDEVQTIGLTDPLNPDSETNSPNCESSGFVLAWIFCGIVDALAESADKLFELVIHPLLRTPDLDITNPEEPLFRVWSSFRTIANAILIIALLVVVFGQAVGGFVDAYTAKKVLPRILVAAIMINLSIYAVALMIDLTNIAAKGISGLIYAPFADTGNFKFQLNEGGGALGVAALVSGMWAVASPAVLSFLWVFVLVPGILAFIGVVAVLLIRRGLIILLVALAPVAFALYCLPNTEKFFKKWWELLSKALLVYPIILGIFAIADVMAITVNQGSQTGGPNALLGGVLSIVLMIAPLFLAPFAFKLAGGAIGSLYAAVSGWNGKGVQFWKGNPNDPWSRGNMSRRRAGNRFLQSRERAVQKGRAWETGTGSDFRRLMGRRMAGLAGGSNYEAARSRMNAEAQELVKNQVGTGGDNLVRAVFAKQMDYIGEDGKRRSGWFGTGTKYNKDTGLVEGKKAADFSGYEVGQARKLFGQNASMYQSALTYEMTKVGDDDEYAEMLQRNIENFQGPNSFANHLVPDAGFIQLGAGYANQSARKEGKHLKLKQASKDGVSKATGVAYKKGELYYDIDHSAFARDMAENIGSYPFANMKPTTAEQFRDTFDWSDDIVSKAYNADGSMKAATDLEKLTDRDGNKLDVATAKAAKVARNDAMLAAQALDMKYGGAGVRGMAGEEGHQVPVIEQGGEVPPALLGERRIHTGAPGRMDAELNNFVDHVLGKSNDRGDRPRASEIMQREDTNVRESRIKGTSV